MPIFYLLFIGKLVLRYSKTGATALVCSRVAFLISDNHTLIFIKIIFSQNNQFSAAPAAGLRQLANGQVASQFVWKIMKTAIAASGREPLLSAACAMQEALNFLGNEAYVGDR